MIPKFRVWDTHEEVMNRVNYIDFANGIVGLSNENVRDYEQPIHRVKFMQSTDLFDKNGTEIYEGDILKLNVPTYKTSTKVIYTLYDAFVLENNVESDDYIEVLGNIHDHPHLLEK